MNIDDILTLQIIGYDHEGIGVAKYDNMPVFVKNTIVGEKVKAKITYMNSKIASADVLEIIEESPNRCKNVCKYYSSCGGCDIFHMDYAEQLRFKREMVVNTLRKVGNIETEVLDVTPNSNELYYRNKIIVPLKKIGSEIISGFYAPKSHEIVAQDLCMIEHKLAKDIIKYIKELLIKYDVSIYDEASHTGLVRNIMLRVNCKNEFMLVLVSTKNNKILGTILDEVSEKFKEIKSLYININPNKTNVILAFDGFIHYGLEKYIVEYINDLKFIVHPNSFLQVNHDQSEALYNKALEYIKDDKSQTIIDAYCGIGSITLNLASKARHVYGIEIVEDAVKNANVNKELNNIENVTFICGKCEEEILKLKSLNVDTMVFDPPRKGCDTKFLDTVIQMDVKNIVYISCLTSSFARDARYLIDHGYELKRVHPFDLFSQTHHTENLGYFCKK